MALVVGRVTLVWSRGPRGSISFHQVKLRAPVASDLVGIAVTKGVGFHPDISSFVLAGHLDSVEGSDTAALVLAQVNVPLDGSAKQVWLEVIWVFRVKRATIGDVSTAVGGSTVIGVGSRRILGEISGNVEGLLLAVDLDLDLVKSLIHFLLLMLK